MIQPDRVRRILKGLDRLWPEATCSLDHEGPLQLLVATILSAQCTDERVNLVTPGLFQRFPAAADYARVPVEELQERIRSTGFFRNKAKSIQGAARLLVERHGGEVPRAMEALLELPGVARKTANVVMGTAFGEASGVVVDTHVFRVSRRLGLTRQATPEKVERDLMKLLPKDRWIRFSHQVIQHGRNLCLARSPRCEACALLKDCDRKGVKTPFRPVRRVWTPRGS
jgi:endonuclease-3